MRLEEWQKWLDSQFLDEESVPPTPTESDHNSDATVVNVFATTPEGSYVHSARSEVSAPTLPGYDGMIESSVRTDAPESLPDIAEERAPSRPAISPKPVAPPYVAGLPTASAPARPAPSYRSAVPIEDDIAVPAIEQYLPFLRSRQEESVAVEQTEPPARQEVAENTESAEQALVAHDPTPVTATPAPADEAATTAPQETPPETEKAAEPVMKAAEPAPLVRAQGASSYRPRRARSRKTERLPAPMAAEEVWTLVPRHLRALVAMSGNEVAQNSYKRSFKESRIELIQRLLDPTLSLEETARLLNVCPTTVRRYTNRGQLRHQRTGGDQRRFKLSDVLAFLETQSQTSPPSER